MFRNAYIYTVLLFVLSACSISLLPSYDEAIANGLAEANTETLTLFSALSGGSSQGEFNKHEGSYNAVIGKFSGLLTLVNTRTQPELSDRAQSKLEKIPRIEKACKALAADGSSEGCFTLVTPAALGEVIETLSRMRDRHKSRGLGSVTVASFLATYEPALEQALTIETALE